ncbi:hypothetical protein N7449_008086 [Penicillium cf. viridicatum]|uniref:Uncharacterized protein n=1 Tax=Penicillium cf. viridicatum TaxID=2972119 RepID=A0A9W9JKG5_9EURO|nr:hypothetical protein N7449_008086 [Penicillium cf. viridicatum]
MSTLTPHHVGFTTLTFHLASLLYIITHLFHPLDSLSPHTAQGFGKTISAFSQHNEQQPGLQFAAIQYQNPPTSLFLLLCDDEWKILPTGPVADAGSPWCHLSQESHLSSFSICLPRILLHVSATTSTFCA